MLLAMLLAAPLAQAQLYRWVDPATGGPTVELIPSPRAQPPKPPSVRALEKPQ